MSANPVSSTQIELSFSEALATSTAESTQNYFLNPYLKITGASLETGGTKVKLNVEAQTSSTIYTVIVKNLMDMQGNYIQSNNSVEFEGIP